MAVRRGFSTLRRPFRELVCPDLEEPVGGRIGRQERRSNHRFARRLPVVLAAGGRELAATCVDIGYGGIGVMVPAGAQASIGRHVEARIELNNRTFEDAFSIVHLSRADGGTNIRLGLAAS